MESGSEWGGFCAEIKELFIFFFTLWVSKESSIAANGCLLRTSDSENDFNGQGDGRKKVKCDRDWEREKVGEIQGREIGGVFFASLTIDMQLR